MRDRSLPILADEMTGGVLLLLFGLVAAATLPVEGKIAGLLNFLMLSAECSLPAIRVTTTGDAGDLLPVTFEPLEVVFTKGLGPYHYTLGLLGFFLWWPWEEFNDSSRSRNGLNGPKRPKSKKEKKQQKTYQHGAGNQSFCIQEWCAPPVICRGLILIHVTLMWCSALVPVLCTGLIQHLALLHSVRALLSPSPVQY